jgi:hypothetical protein
MKHDTKWTKSVLFNFLRNGLKSTIACYRFMGPQKLAEAVNICRFVYSLSFFNGFLPNAFIKIFERRKSFFLTLQLFDRTENKYFSSPLNFKASRTRQESLDGFQINYSFWKNNNKVFFPVMISFTIPKTL